MAYFRIKFGMDAKPEAEVKAGNNTYQVLKAKFSNRIVTKK